VISTANYGTLAGTLEVWAGPLQGGSVVLGLVNRGTEDAEVSADWSMLDGLIVDLNATVQVRDLWAGANLGDKTGGFSAAIGPHDIGIYKLEVVV
jgi:alpha-galactosidase